MTQSPEDTASIEPPPGKPLQFRLVHLIYLTSMLAASLSLFGVWGIFFGSVISLIWILAFLNKVGKVFELLIMILIIGFMIVLLLPFTSNSENAIGRMQCSNNLKQIGNALHNYHDSYDSLPPAYLADEQGKPLHSWRVLILPFLEEQALYKQYDFNEPWDGPNNIQLLDQMPDVFACPSHEHKPPKGVQYTSYLAITGEHTVWPADRAMKFSDVTAGLSNTVMVSEFEENRSRGYSQKISN